MNDVMSRSEAAALLMDMSRRVVSREEAEALQLGVRSLVKRHFDTIKNKINRKAERQKQMSKLLTIEDALPCFDCKRKPELRCEDITDGNGICYSAMVVCDHLDCEGYLTDSQKYYGNEDVAIHRAVSEWNDNVTECLQGKNRKGGAK